MVGVDGVIIPVARKLVELEHNYNTDIVTILLPQEEEINDLEMHRKQETVILREVMVCKRVLKHDKSYTYSLLHLAFC